MSSRDAILTRIRTALSHDAPLEPPPVPQVWPRRSPPRDEMIRQFTTELEAVSGEVIRVATMDQARQRLADLMAAEKWEKIGAMDRAGCRDVAKTVAAERVTWARPDWSPQGMAELSAAIVEADVLLADTGSAMVACGRPEERLLCYLPPACVVVATADRLVEHLPAAWPEIARRVADPQLRGEFVFITGPSRTADIEKILILGVHGPKRLIVLLVG
jgi:L-lactate dehydrogenase complex protein LldG